MVSNKFMESIGLGRNSLPPKPELADEEIEELIAATAEMVGVHSRVLRGGRTNSLVRPYRAALYHIMAREFGLSQRVIAKKMQVNRNTVVDGLKAAESDDDVRAAAVLIRTRMRRLAIGL